MQAMNLAIVDSMLEPMEEDVLERCRVLDGVDADARSDADAARYV
jgi:hypothetical protein